MLFLDDLNPNTYDAHVPYAHVPYAHVPYTHVQTWDIGIPEVFAEK